MGSTYYDFQHNASTGRQVDEDGGTVQVSWMKAPGPSISVRTVNWARALVVGSPTAYTLSNGDSVRFVPVYGVPGSEEHEFTAVRPGYTNLRLRPGGKAVVIYHDAPEQGGIQFKETRLDLSAGSGVFATPSTLPPVPGDMENLLDAIWPKQAISVCGADLVHHTVATWSGGMEEVWYWRGYINDSTGKINWATAMPAGLPKLIDSASAGISAVIESNGDTVYIILAKQINPFANADLVYYRSTNCGVTWGPMVNVTGFTDYDPEGLWMEVGAVFDEGGEIHVIFNTVPIGGLAGGLETPVNLYHWSPSTGIRLITSAPWDPACPCPGPICISPGGAGATNVSLSEPTLAVKPAGLHGIADELLIAVWTQYGPTENDCAGAGSQGFTNAELYLSVSSNGGLTWDRPQNVTGTETPGCLPGDCLSEAWVSASAQADSAIYLSYVEDRDAGPAVLGNGTWTENPYKVLAVETRVPVPAPVIHASPQGFVELHADPLAGTVEHVEVVISNSGTATLNFTVWVTPDDGGTGYVTVEGSPTYMGAIPAGGAPDSIDVAFNTLGLPDPSEHNWRIQILSNALLNKQSAAGVPIDIHLQVFAASVWHTCDTDTLSTGLHRMQVSSCLEMGDFTRPGTGFFTYSNSAEWLASGSPVLTHVRLGDALTYYNAHLYAAQRTRAENRSFRALSEMVVARDTLLVLGDTQIVADRARGSASTTDTLIGLDYEVIFPKTVGMQHGAWWNLSMHNLSGSTLTGLTYGALAHLEIDPGPLARGIGSQQKGWLGAVGGELDTLGMFYANTNYMALFLINAQSPCFSPPGAAAQILDNAFYLNPLGQYHPDSLHELLTTFGALQTWDTIPHIDTGQSAADLTVLLISKYNATLGVADTMRWSFGIASSELSRADLETTIDAVRLASNPQLNECCPIIISGDVNGSGNLTSADVIYLVNYIFKQGPCPLPCCANGNVNCGPNVSSPDIIYLVNYVFKSGPPPCNICIGSPQPCIP